MSRRESNVSRWYVASAVALLATSGCSFGVHPSAEVLSKRLTGDPNSVDETFLRTRGFELLDIEGGGPLLADGKCYEKSRGLFVLNAYGGADVVRVCIENGSGSVFVFAMETHGIPWTEIFPTDMSATKPVQTDFFLRASEETLGRLKK